MMNFLYTDDNDDGMVVLQALVEGTVLEVHTPGPKVKDADIAPLVELYVHQYGSEVSSIAYTFQNYVLFCR